MLDPKVIRENPDAARAGALKKHFPARAEAVDKFLELDAKVRELIPQIDGMRSEQKAASKEMGKVMGSLSPEEREEYLAKQTALKMTGINTASNIQKLSGYGDGLIISKGHDTACLFHHKPT